MKKLCKTLLPPGAASLLVMLAASFCQFAASPAVAADSVYLEPAEFLAGAFHGAAPQVRVLWITPEIRGHVIRILGHEPGQLRQKYWTDGQKVAWILDEIGKEEPITAGFVIKNGRIEQAKVLIFRESRGGEIRYPSFLAQFQAAGLIDGHYLNKQIDAISGATLSVNAMVRMSREALYLTRMVEEK